MELLHCIFAGTCSFPLLKIPSMISVTRLIYWQYFKVILIFFFFNSLPVAGVCLLLPLLARSLKDPGETFKS